MKFTYFRILFALLLVNPSSPIAQAKTTEFPSFDEPMLTRLLNEAKSWSVFIEGADPKDPERKVSNARIKYIAKDRMFWAYEVGWNFYLDIRSFDWAKRSSDSTDYAATIKRLISTGFFNTPPSFKKSTFNIGVEVASGDDSYKWTWPAQKDSAKAAIDSRIKDFFDEFGRKPKSNGSNTWWFSKRPGSLSLTTGMCETVSPDGSYEAHLYNNGEEPVKLRGLQTATIKSYPYAVQITNGGTEDFVIPAERSVRVNFKIDLNKPTTDKIPKDAELWFSIPNPVIGVDVIEGPARLISSGCEVSKIDKNAAKIRRSEIAKQDALHGETLKKMDDKERAVLSKSYPQSKIVALCDGNFSGGPNTEKLLILTKGGQQAVERVALIRKGDEVLAKTLDLDANSSWNYTFDRKKFKGVFHCGVKPGSHEDIQDPGSNARVDRKKDNLLGDTACFSTDHVYNNWDCFLYDPAKEKFVLWFSQGHAD